MKQQQGEGGLSSNAHKTANPTGRWRTVVGSVLRVCLSMPSVVCLGIDETGSGNGIEGGIRHPSARHERGVSAISMPHRSVATKNCHQRAESSAKDSRGARRGQKRRIRTVLKVSVEGNQLAGYKS